MAPHVETRWGSIRGSETAGIRVFRAIRYARAPIGPLRFLPPVAPEPWTGVREATQPAAPAPQPSLPWLGWINAALRRPEEDCLSLNVWTPGLDGARRPVLVWIHGGGFLVGSASTPLYDGRDLARRGDVVVVTLNYRLGALGYTHLAGVLGEGFEESSNLGVRDQIAALEWVRDHIDRFGGDPGNVTLFGQSAGAMSIAALLGAPRARPLFHRAICQSGAADHVFEAEEACAIARVFLEELGGPPASHRILGRIPIDRIVEAQMATMRRLANLQNLMVFRPVVDGDLIPEQPLAAVRGGATAHIPLLVGSTLDEWKLFRMIDEGYLPMRERELRARFREVLRDEFPRAPDGPKPVRDFRAALRRRGGRPGTSEVWSAFQSSRVFHFPASRLAEAQEAGGGSAHAYLFTWRSPLAPLGACHALDIPFVFGSTGHPLARPITGFTASAGRLSRKIQHAWIGFARGGDPGDERLPDWPRYEPERRATMILGRDCSLEHAPLDAERELLARWAQEPPAARSARLPSRRRSRAGS